MDLNIVGASQVNRQKRIEIQKIEHVHIGVFFDGTSNNMVQQAYFHTLKNHKTNTENGTRSVSYKRQEKTYNDVLERIERRGKKAEELSWILYNHENYLGLEKKHCVELVEEINNLDEEIERLQAESHIDVKTMYNDTENGYSNIAILHSVINHEHETATSLYYNIYVEGSGATDITFSQGGTQYIDEKNTNGLGFGLGKTGVTALVSKAVKYVHLYLSSQSSKLSDETNYHFYVFGFSRGATCARLFSELTTRKPGKTLKREKEFGQNTSKAKKLYDKNNHRLPFMETHFVEGVTINRDKVTVDFLGIFDTVASIGFLKQKDGWTNTLKMPYLIFGSNYRGNYHYMNSHDYGLFSHHNKRVLHTCHICAGDEFRENFALVNLGRSIPQTAMEIIIPGCHSDVGGGYVTENSQDFLLYKFKPRKMEHFIKSDKLKEIIFFPYLKSKKRASLLVHDPMDNSQVEELNPKTLAKLGWIGNEWRGGGVDICPEDNKPYTMKVKDWPNEISFKRFAVRGYSNIPLKMMKSCVEKCGVNWLFKATLSPYSIPSDLRQLDAKMEQYIDIPKGQRLWLLPDGSNSSEKYRKLRLRYLHFTSTCEMGHLRKKIDDEKLHRIKDEGSERETVPIQLDGTLANFGNNCNYDNEACISRIMYDGDEILDGDHTDNVHYTYELGNYGMKIREI